MAATPASPQVHIESVQTGLPTRVVEPDRTRVIAVAAPPLPATALQRRLRAVFYYRGDDAPLEEGIWVKESLGEVLCFFPEMAGRLRRHADGSWEVKLNDAGVRFQQATVEVTMEDFLADKDRARKEAALAPWVDVSAEDPDMCSLLFMQLNRFQGGGYAIGVSCTVLLSDPLSLARFLRAWARTHAEMKEQSKVAPTPMMQYMAYFQRPEICCKRIRSFPVDSVAADGVYAQTVLFRAAAGDLRALAAACIDRASEELGADRPSRFTLVVAPGDPARGATTVETSVTADDLKKGGAGHALEAAEWSELGLEELAIRDVKPVHVSYRIVAGGDEGLVVVMPDGDGFLVTATVPKLTRQTKKYKNLRHAYLFRGLNKPMLAIDIHENYVNIIYKLYSTLNELLVANPILLLLAKVAVRCNRRNKLSPLAPHSCYHLFSLSLLSVTSAQSNACALCLCYPDFTL